MVTGRDDSVVLPWVFPSLNEAIGSGIKGLASSLEHWVGITTLPNI